MIPVQPYICPDCGFTINEETLRLVCPTHPGLLEWEREEIRKKLMSAQSPDERFSERSAV